jgi:hypothetical protein
MFGRKRKLPTIFRLFGEMGVVITKDDIQGKLKNHGLTRMFVGYPVDRANDIYRTLTLNSKMIFQMIDLVWIEKWYNH